MADHPTPASRGTGTLARNIVVFARVLRSAGLPVGLDRTVAAVRAVDAVGLEHREDLRAALAATLLGADGSTAGEPSTSPEFALSPPAFTALTT
jgi:uncharacterized protein with von Willebrand factor type A (vWA) domain